MCLAFHILTRSDWNAIVILNIFFFTSNHCIVIFFITISDVKKSALKVKRKEMFHLTTHSTHFTLQLYGVSTMVKEHSAREETRWSHYT